MLAKIVTLKWISPGIVTTNPLLSQNKEIITLNVKSKEIITLNVKSKEIITLNLL